MKEALLVIDVQRDFLPGGALPVPQGDEVVPVIESLASSFDLKVATQDWHPEGHASFRVWPEHCVQGSAGAEMAIDIDFDKIVQKGVDPEIDSYSGFVDNDRVKQSELHPYLQHRGVEKLVVAGVATDYCVLFTVLDALELGYRVELVLDGMRGVEVAPGNCKKAIDRMMEKGATLYGATVDIL